MGAPPMAVRAQVGPPGKTQEKRAVWGCPCGGPGSRDNWDTRLNCRVCFAPRPTGLMVGLPQPAAKVVAPRAAKSPPKGSPPLGGASVAAWDNGPPLSTGLRAPEPVTPSTQVVKEEQDRPPQEGWIKLDQVSDELLLRVAAVQKGTKRLEQACAEASFQQAQVQCLQERLQESLAQLRSRELKVETLKGELDLERARLVEVKRKQLGEEGVPQ